MQWVLYELEIILSIVLFLSVRVKLLLFRNKKTISFSKDIPTF